ncbi:energy-coupling factor transporter transmembrane protein EcfT [Rhodococcus sp. ACPA4]|uniref:Biotin transport system permease protein n=1 Tax=Nocardia globerula TaxID=1818 RepID=A0A652YK84_NOCGL|nr:MULTISPECIES: energy-coupling factor transporter transmembrane component T [Rhodococcus]NMD61835.1 energy-coupling factor transporter transmembrane protein EcfT [Nocardia globerula]NRI64087.1 energy-coupling factor transporter transmembrane protein EcfT [Rhodococcus sp. MS16]KJF22304.1 Energy-coupling factor transporter transmembrane protein BioN [Rhodococcus sp. AD45]MCE4268608.1 energy-coupling factor transporter transmembrane protein EcfT [Rhodococcus globerulus]MDV8067946.1 energy-coupl
MTTLGHYRAGTSILHRARPGYKLLALIVAIVAVSVFVRSPWQLVPPTVVVVALYVAARIPFRIAIAHLRPALWMLLFIGGFQILVAGWERAAVVCGVLILSIALAALMGLTTRISEMLDAITAFLTPLRRFGVNPERIALLLAMTIRCIPLMFEVITQVSEARKARGLGFSLRSFAVPVIIGTLMTADAMGEALAARGADD